jgi:hypothetical protein
LSEKDDIAELLDKAELLLNPIVPSERLDDDIGKAMLDDDFTERLEDIVLTLSRDLDETSSSFKLFADVDELSPQAIKSRANKKESHKFFFITVNIKYN